MRHQQFGTSDSLEALVSICPSKEERRNQKSGRVYSKEFQAMLDSLESEDCSEESGAGLGKKRRLRMDQVRALEKYFEVENKLEPDRKLKLAEELGLEPRQVAIWFQNRRARWKTKQLERDFRLLKANYDSLNLDFTSLQQEKEALSLELEELKEKLRRRKAENSPSPLMPDSAGNNFSSEQSKSGGLYANGDETALKAYGDFKDNGSSDSDSNGIFKDQNDIVYNSQLQLLSMSPPPGTAFQNVAGVQQQQPVTNWYQLPDMGLIPAAQQHVVKMEEEGLFDSEESCNIYSVDQAPTLHWYFPE